MKKFFMFLAVAGVLTFSAITASAQDEQAAAPAATEQGIEAYTHLRHKRASVGSSRRCYFNCGDKVFLAVGTGASYRKLTAGKYNGLAQIFKHKTQSGRAVSHGIRAVKHDKSVIPVIFFLYERGQGLPESRLHVRRVYERVESAGVYLEREFTQLRHFLHNLLKIERLESPVCRVLFHAYSASRINKEYGRPFGIAFVKVCHKLNNLTAEAVVMSAICSMPTFFISAILAAIKGMFALSLRVPRRGVGAR